MTDAPIEQQRTVFLADLQAGRGERRFAGAVVAASVIGFLALAPFAKVPLPALTAFIPIYQSALVINDVITVVFLLGQRQFAESRGIAFLAAGYLFTALMSIVHALTFPGLFAPGGLLGAGPQTTAWLYMFWHGGFPVFVVAYALYRPSNRTPSANSSIVLGGAALVFAAVFGFTLVATWGSTACPRSWRAITTPRR
jgi:hypothetical protein